MFIGRVVGNLWATKKHDSLEGKRLLLVQPIDAMSEAAAGEPLLVLDRQIDAGPGDTVLVMDEGNSARQVLADSKAPVRAVVVGIVGPVVVGGRTVKFH